MSINPAQYSPLYLELTKNEQLIYPSEFDYKELELAHSTYTKELDTKKIAFFFDLCPELLRPIVKKKCNEYIDLFGEKSIIYLVRILISEFYQDYQKTVTKSKETSQYREILDTLYFSYLQSLEYLKRSVLGSSVPKENVEDACTTTNEFFIQCDAIKYQIPKVVKKEGMYQKFNELFKLLQILSQNPSVLGITIGEIAQAYPSNTPISIEEMTRKIFKNLQFDYAEDRIKQMHNYVCLTTKNEEDQYFSKTVQQNSLNKLQDFFKTLINKSKELTDTYFSNSIEVTTDFDYLSQLLNQTLQTLKSGERELFECFSLYSFPSLYFDLINKVIFSNSFKINLNKNSLIVSNPQIFEIFAEYYEMFFRNLPFSEDIIWKVLGEPTPKEKELLMNYLITPLTIKQNNCERLLQIDFFKLFKKYIFQFIEEAKKGNTIKAAFHFSRFQVANIILATCYAALMDAYKKIDIEDLKSKLQDPTIIEKLNDLNIYYNWTSQSLLEDQLFIIDFGSIVHSIQKKKKKKKRKTIKPVSDESPPEIKIIPSTCQTLSSEALKEELPFKLPEPAKISSEKKISTLTKTVKLSKSVLENGQTKVKTLEPENQTASLERILKSFGPLSSYLDPRKFLKLMKEEFNLKLVNSKGKHNKLVDNEGHKIPFPSSNNKDLRIGTAKAILEEAYELTRKQ